jgi:hypothetical protein
MADCTSGVFVVINGQRTSIEARCSKREGHVSTNKRHEARVDVMGRDLKEVTKGMREQTTPLRPDKPVMLIVRWDD